MRIEGEAIVFLVDNAEMTVAFENIDKARIMPDWVALGFAPKPKKARPAKLAAAKAWPGSERRPRKKRRSAAKNKPAGKRKRVRRGRARKTQPTGGQAAARGVKDE